MMSKSFVIDTNSLISAVLIEGTSSSRALDKAILLGKLIFSQSTADEFIEVLFRKKLDKYFVNEDRKSTRLNSSHVASSYAVFCLKKKKTDENRMALALRSGRCRS